MSQMLKSSGAMAAATMTSRVLGMVREMVYARFMGDGWVAGAFQLAFTIPSLFRRLLGEGALTAAFIPIFKEKESAGNSDEMWRAANAVVSGLVVVAAIITGVVMIGISVALAARDFDGQATLMLELLRVMFPYMLLVCVAAVFMGMLNARGHFFIPSLGAAMLNVVMIASVLWLAPKMGEALHDQIFALAIGVLVAGVAQALFQLPALGQQGFRYRWITPWKDETVRRVVKQMLPATIGVAAFQINVVLTQGLAYWVDDYVVASFQYAVRLMELPQGLFGISLATYLLPTLAAFATEKRYDDFRTELRQGLGYLIFANIIASVLLLVLAEPIIRLLFEGRKFDENSTSQATLALVCLAPGLLAFSVVNILARAFYALGDTKTPMKTSVFCLIVNLLLAAVLVWRFKQGGLGIANTLTSLLNVGLLTYGLRRKLKCLDLQPLRAPTTKLAVAGIVAGFTAWWLAGSWASKLGHASVALRIGEVFVPAVIAGICYWAFALMLRVPAAQEVTHFLFKGRLKKAE